MIRDDCSGHANSLQKTKIPARGLKPTMLGHLYRYPVLAASKNQNPREGIETGRVLHAPPLRRTTSKNQNPREGIETQRQWRHPASTGLRQLQKTKIPARGLKRSSALQPDIRQVSFASKNQNPREGIETLPLVQSVMRLSNPLQKTKIPARGLKPTTSTATVAVRTRSLQKTKIPARGLKPRNAASAASCAVCCDFKKPKSPRGD